ncbi:MAG TPA: NHLP bacteriocin system secretion protein [Synergistaceae bacterium]|nr:NHLP bacteriocin system secretion protein [Synergistaceae bacterium]HPQ36869.1 NHLP bacteriocin system secretion protein [Synergistaceae bacterium]
MKKQVFRQSALDRLSSPEQLDLLFRVVPPASWFALLAILLLLGALLGWGFYGTVATKVTGQGILLRQGALEEVPSPGTGRIEMILADIDDYVEKGEIIARLAQPELRHQMSELEGKLEILEIEQDMGEEMGEDKKSLEAEYLARRRNALTASLEVTRERAAALEEQLQQYNALYQKKYITRSQYLDVKDKYNAALQEILSRREELARLPMTAADSTTQLEREKIDVRMRLLAAREQLRALKDRLELESFVRSPATGRVLEIFKTPGQVIQSGEALLSVEKVGDQEQPLYVHAFVQPQHGKKISSGMEAQISPSVVKQEEFGVLLGHVTRVSRYPASLKGMMRILGNDQLAKSLSQGGAPITVTVALRPSAETESGYAWSSGGGPPLKLQSGTLTGITVVVHRQAPVTLVLPFLKKFFLGVGEERPSEESHDR